VLFGVGFSFTAAFIFSDMAPLPSMGNGVRMG